MNENWTQKKDLETQLSRLGHGLAKAGKKKERKNTHSLPEWVALR